MPSLINPAAIRPYGSGSISLGKGLDQTSPAGLAAPGSLRDCLNFEVVDGFLQCISGVLPMGKNALNSTYDLYILLGTANTDFTKTGTITDKESVTWYPDSTSLNDPLGTGVWLDGSINSVPYVAILHLTGEPPTGQVYFKGASSAAEITITDDDYQFALPSDSYTNLTELVYADALSSMYSTLSQTWAWGAMRPSPLQMYADDGGVSHIIQCNDNLYAVCDFPVVGFWTGVEEPSIGDKISIGYGTPVTAYIAHIEVTQGDWEDGDAGGWLYLYPQSDSTLNDNTLAGILSGNDDTITNVDTGNTLGNTLPQTGSNDVKVHKYHGQLWKLDTTTRVNTGWSWVHPGYSVRFGNDDTTVDQTAPNTQVAPLFVSDGISTLANTGQLSFNTPTEEPAAGGTLSAWSNLTNLVSDDAAYATSTPLAGDATRKLTFKVAASTAIPDTAKITGVEITFEAFAAATDVVYCSVAQLRNDAAADDNLNKVWHASENRGRSIEDPLTAAPTVFTVGGDLDLWGLEEIPIADWNAQDIEFDLQFANTDASSRLVSVDYVWIKVYYTINAKDVYFVRDGSDITNGQIFAYQVHDGDWSTDDAKGWLSFENIDDPDLVLPGDAIWTGTGGTGDFIGNVRALYMNSFPSYGEMVDARTRSRTKVSSLGSEEGEETAYCVNGVGPAWALDANDRVRFIRTPVSPEKDKPRFVDEHRNHLLLGLNEHFIVSAISAPDVMATFDGATTWHVRDRISGVHHTTDGTTIILCRDSIHQFQGASASGQDPFGLSTITNKGGAKEYSSIEMGDIYFLTTAGLSSVAATDKFGNFELASVSSGVSAWLRDRINQNRDSTGKVSDKGLIDSMPVRSKNQLRFYFNDGYILTATLGGEGPPEFTFQNYGAAQKSTLGATGGTDSHAFNFPFNYTPTALHSAFTSWGEERLYFGKLASVAEIWLLDTGSTAYIGDTETIRGFIGGFIELNPMFFAGAYDKPSQVVGANLAYDCPTRPNVQVYKGTDFEPPRVLDLVSAASEPYLVTATNQGFEESVYTGNRLTYMGTSHIGGYAHAHSWAIAHYSEWSSVNKPLRLISFAAMAQIREGSARAQSKTDIGTTLPRTR